MHVHLPRITARELQKVDLNAETSRAIKKRVVTAREAQLSRQGELNSELGNKGIEQHCHLSDAVSDFLEGASERLQLSARGYHRIVRLARTIADMVESNEIQKQHLAEALNYRRLDRL